MEQYYLIRMFELMHVLIMFWIYLRNVLVMFWISFGYDFMLYLIINVLEMIVL